MKGVTNMNPQIVIAVVVGLAALVLLVRFVGPLSPGKHTYTEIVIEAPPEKVWAVLSDSARYPEWNPYHVHITGEFIVGEPLVVDVHKPNGEEVTVKPHLLRLEPYRELTWGGGIRGVFYGEHVFLLEETAEGHTHLIHKEDFIGLAVQFVPLDGIDEGYTGMNQALKDWIEAGN
jgi:hypothetical protein